MKNKITLCLAVSLLGYLSLGANSEMNSHIGEKVSIEQLLKETKNNEKDVSLPKDIFGVSEILQQQLNLLNDAETIRVDVVLNSKLILDNTESFGRMSISKDGEKHFFYNGEEKTKDFFNDLREKEKKHLVEFKEKIKINYLVRFMDTVQNYIQFLDSNALKTIKESYLNGESVIELTLNKIDINKLSKLTNIVLAIEEHKNYKESNHISSQVYTSPTLEGAKHDSGIANSAGGAGVSVGVMEAFGCPPSDSYNNYKRIKGDYNIHGDSVVEILKSVSTDSNVECMPIDRKMNLSKYDLVNHSWKVIGSQYSKKYTSSDLLWDRRSIETNSLQIVSSGNQANDKNDKDENAVSITSPGKGLNVLTVGNYLYTSHEKVNSSSYRDSNLLTMKPELSGPGEYYLTTRGGVDSGTSYSSPFVTGMLANLLSEQPFLKGKPYLIKAVALSATSIKLDSSEEEIGLGGINQNTLMYNATLNYFEKIQPKKGEEFIVTRNLIKGEKVKAAIAWEVEPHYTFIKQRIGKNYDMVVVDPDNNIVCWNSHMYNPFEVCEFTAQKSGKYKLKAYLYKDKNPYIKTTYPWYQFWNSDKEEGFKTSLGMILNVQ